MGDGGVVKHSKVKPTWGGGIGRILQVFLRALVWIHVVGAPPAIAEHKKRQTNEGKVRLHVNKVGFKAQITTDFNQRSVVYQALPPEGSSDTSAPIKHQYDSYSFGFKHIFLIVSSCFFTLRPNIKILNKHRHARLRSTTIND